MQRDDFMKLKLKFAQTDVAGKIAIYTETPGLSAAQYKELLRMYPIDRLEELEAVLAKPPEMPLPPPLPDPEVQAALRFSDQAFRFYGA